MSRVRLFIGVAVMALAATVAGSALATPVTAGPCASFRVLGTDLDLDYNPFSPTPIDHAFLLRVTRLDPTVSAVRFLLTDPTPAEGRSRIGPAGPFDYSVVWQANTGQQVFYAHSQTLNAADTVTTSFGSGAGNVQTVEFALHVPQGQPVAASRQADNIEIEYQCQSGPTVGGPQVQDDNRVRIRLAIPRYFGAYIGSPGRNRGEIDFGTLDGDTSSAEKHVTVTAVSTVAYTIGVKTDRGSELRRDDKDPDGIPYTMEFANMPVKDNSLLSCPMTQSSLGDTEQLKVKLDGRHLDQLHAGAYRDTITLTFTPSDLVRHSDGCQLQP